MKSTKRIASLLLGLALALPMLTIGVFAVPQSSIEPSYRVTAVSSGFNHALALLEDGSVWSWGYNVHGELGLDHTMSMSIPAQIRSLPDSGVIQVSAGLYHSMALTQDGQIYIWGHNVEGQLGIGKSGPEPQLTPVALDLSPFDGKVIAISAGYYHSMALTDKGSVYTWGDHSYGGTGLGKGGGNQPAPMKVDLPEAIKAISGGYSSSMVLGESGAVYTTGYNGYGDLGLGHAVSKYTFQKVNLPEAVTQISNNGYHMIVLTEKGNVYGWGKNDTGDVGTGKPSHVLSPYKVSIPLDAGDKIVSVNAGYEHSSVITEKGKLYSWGLQLNGRLGDGAVSGYQRTPKYIRDQVSGITDGGGYQYQIVIASDGRAYSAGLDAFGRMGNDKQLGTMDKSSNASGFVPVEFYPDRFLVKEVSVGFNHALAIAHDGTIWSWGYNDHGELGLGHKNGMTVPTMIKMMTCKNVVQVSVGLYHSMALTQDGQIYIWGHNVEGQLGSGKSGPEPRLTPELLDLSPFDGKVIAISAGYYHSMALTDKGSVYTWGDHSYGGTGLGKGGGNQPAPKKVDLPEPIKAISGGYSSSMVLGESGAVYTTGYNGYGDLGLGHAVSKYTFQKVNLPEKVTQISNNGYHMMVLTEKGNVYGWGKNDTGDVGTGKPDHVLSPYKVSVPLDAGDKIVSINAGYEHSSVVTEKGKLYSWGLQLNGRLGDGAVSGYQRTPKYIRDGVADVTNGGGYQYQIVVLESGEAWTAGYDAFGRMGNDSDIGLRDGSSGAEGFVPVEFMK